MQASRLRHSITSRSRLVKRFWSFLGRSFSGQYFSGKTNERTRFSRFPLLISSLLSMLIFAEGALAQIALSGGLPWRGFNLAGAEFAGGLVQGAFPGVHGDDYVYPDSTFVPGYDTPQQFVDKGANMFRLPFRWERLQPNLNSPLDADELSRLTTTVTNLTGMGAFVLLDPHNYARYSTGNPDEVRVIGSPELPTSTFADFWARVADQFKDNPQVVFGIMNEPYDIDTAQWIGATNDAIAAIRATGATNVIFVQGGGWGSSWWFETTDAAQLLNIQDPLNRYAIEAHIYFNDNDSGGDASCVSEQIGVERISQVTNWMRANNRLAFIGEIGAGESQTCLTAIDNVLDHMEANQDIYLGYTFWAAGPYWGEDYELALEPRANGEHRPQVDVIEQHFSWGNGTGLCNDGIQNGTESDIDCGGICGQCTTGDSCDVDAECDSWNCESGTCAAASCTDGIQNGDELAQDCGGSCERCVCQEATYEAENINSSTGGAVPDGWNIWSDGYVSTTHNFTGTEDEIIVRARGEIAAGEWPHMVLSIGGIVMGETNVTSTGFQNYVFTLPSSILGNKEVRIIFDNDLFDEASGQDRNLIVDKIDVSCGAVIDTCSNGILDGLETDVDCGGTCGACSDGQVCSISSDCASGNCDSGACISCEDGIQNGGETDIDCGGVCGSCSDGQACSSNNECSSNNCENGSCVSCSDGLLNGDETDVDCGGSCGSCSDGQSCSVNADCGSGSCEDGSCISCSDGIKNGTETDVDCGGICGSCPTDDDDFDGVINANDACDGTPLGTSVDIRGCALINEVTIEAENYEAANDSDAGNNNTGGVTQCTYNGLDVDVQDASEGGCNVGWTADGEWLTYTVPLSAGIYQVETLVASNVSSGAYTLTLGGSLIGSDSVSATGGWQVWETHNLGEVTVEAGDLELRVDITGSSLNLNWIRFTAVTLFVDADLDGVRDDQDDCLGTVLGSIVDANGCVTDSDGDGIPDDQDNCEDTPLGTLVGNDGCPLVDTDGDGVPDINDACSGTPVGEALVRDGCSDSQLDDDNDGFLNPADLCPGTPTGEAIVRDGCSNSQLDDDNDGVVNTLDLCPETPAGEANVREGCSDSQLDDDNDGFVNSVDVCPGTPEGETIILDGCSDSQLDDDNDGVVNSLDSCPNTPAGEANVRDGCSNSQLDDDNDGVVNSLDLCDGTPAGEALVRDGCSNSQLDDDNDGVVNTLDLCSGTPAGEENVRDGCSNSQLDDDNDGFVNSIDLCPGTPLGEMIIRDGCSDSQLDDDGDGVVNSIDACPGTPAGEANVRDGCSNSQLDDDNDGVFNSLDLCPGTPEGEALVRDGCANSQLDDDNDSVLNPADLCPETPVAETANGDGCSISQIDSDGDNVFDHEDQCENTPAGEAVNGVGCSASQQLIPLVVYPAASIAGGPGLLGCTGTAACTDQAWGVDLNGGAGFGWVVDGGGSGGAVELFISVGVPSGSRAMSVWVNGSEVGVIATNATDSPRSANGSEFGPFVAILKAGDNSVELRDTEGTAEFDVHQLRVALPDNTPANLLSSDGTIPAQGDFVFYIHEPAGAAASFDFAGEIHFGISAVAALASWHVQLQHPMSITGGQEYTICFDARAAANRTLDVNVDEGAPDYGTLSEITTVDLTTTTQSYDITFTASADDDTARLTFNAGLSAADVWLDNIGVYAGAECGNP